MQFEVGQEVAIRSGYGYPRYQSGVVERVTPSGQVILVGGRRFRANGVEFTASSYREKIEPMTPQIVERIRRGVLVDRLRSVEWQDLPLETLEAVAAALGQ
jgi:hypothetical protein